MRRLPLAARDLQADGAHTAVELLAPGAGVNAALSWPVVAPGGGRAALHTAVAAALAAAAAPLASSSSSDGGADAAAALDTLGLLVDCTGDLLLARAVHAVVADLESLLDLEGAAATTPPAPSSHRPWGLGPIVVSVSTAEVGGRALAAFASIAALVVRVDRRGASGSSDAGGAGGGSSLSLPLLVTERSATSGKLRTYTQHCVYRAAGGRAGGGAPAAGVVVLRAPDAGGTTAVRTALVPAPAFPPGAVARRQQPQQPQQPAGSGAEPGAAAGPSTSSAALGGGHGHAHREGGHSHSPAAAVGEVAIQRPSTRAPPPAAAAATAAAGGAAAAAVAVPLSASFVPDEGGEYDDYQGAPPDAGVDLDDDLDV